MANNPYVNKVVFGSTTLIDISDTTAVAADVASGKVFYGADGSRKTGSGGGGSSEWELIASKEITVSTTSTSASRIEWWYFDDTLAWTGSKAVYIRIRDKAGKRNGYFYGTDSIILNANAKNGLYSGAGSGCMRTCIRVANKGEYQTYTSGSSTGYGVYPGTIDYNDTDDEVCISLMQRYSSSYSLTINGIYTIDVYLLSPPTGKPFFI